jgi:LmbE family N-acetylglucosaminyl deacetylase
MKIHKKSFLIGLMLAPILSISLLGGLGVAQAYGQGQSPDSTKEIVDKTSDFSQPDSLLLYPCQSRIMQVVAHEDDDLLFMNPDLAHSLASGDCIKTIYMTAGDAGQSSDYWLQREKGAEAAYSEMLGLPMDWQISQTKIGGRYVVNVATLEPTASVSLFFVRLPDGNLTGNGFASTSYESLKRLESGQITTLRTVANQASYTLDDLANLISLLINQYQPDQIRTQANDYPDHSDHIAVSHLVSQAYQLYRSQIIAIKSMDLSFYNGYKASSYAPNLTSQDLLQKQAAFLEYAKYDPAVCSNTENCNSQSTYGLYLNRQYKGLE